jgi:hypothetical protein
MKLFVLSLVSARASPTAHDPRFTQGTYVDRVVLLLKDAMTKFALNLCLLTGHVMSMKGRFPYPLAAEFTVDRYSGTSLFVLSELIFFNLSCAAISST